MARGASPTRCRSSTPARLASSAIRLSHAATGRTRSNLEAGACRRYMSDHLQALFVEAAISASASKVVGYLFDTPSASRRCRFHSRLGEVSSVSGRIALRPDHRRLAGPT